MKTLGDLRDLGDLQFDICWSWNCCRFTWPFEESPGSYLSPSKGAVWGYLGGRFDITESLGFVQDVQDIMVLIDEWLAALGLCSVRLLDDTSAGRYPCMSWLLGGEWNKHVYNKYKFTARLLGC